MEDERVGVGVEMVVGGGVIIYSVGEEGEGAVHLIGGMVSSPKVQAVGEVSEITAVNGEVFLPKWQLEILWWFL